MAGLTRTAESLIVKMEKASGLRFHEAQVALAKQWIGDNAMEVDEYVPTEVDISIPQETSEGLLVSEKSQPKKETIKIPETEAKAREMIERFEAGASEVPQAQRVSDNVVQHMMHDSTHLNDEAWEGTEEEELSWCVPL
jgi:phospholipase D1/2